MGEKLTKEEFHRAVGEMDSDSLWELVQSDREAIRAEVREEILKDYFKRGERVSWGVNNCRVGTVRFVEDDGTSPGDDGRLINFHRLPKMRPMTRQERIAAIAKEMGQEYPWMKNANGDTLLDISNWYNIPTEVPE